MAANTNGKQVANAISFGLIAAFAVALVTQSAVFGVIAIIGLGILGGKIVSGFPTVDSKSHSIALYAMGGFLVVVVPLGGIAAESGSGLALQHNDVGRRIRGDGPHFLELRGDQ